MRLIFPAVFILLLLGAAPAMSAGLMDATAASDGLLLLIKNSASTWNNALRGYATDIFWSLALIQLVWTFWPLLLKQADFGELAAELIRWIVITGIFAALLLYSVDWAGAIIDSFRIAAADAAGVSVKLQPGDMFGMAIELGKTVGGVGLVNPVSAFIIAISATLVVMCFTFIAAFMMVTLIESYIVINAGVFFMAFAGSQWTREYAMAMLRYSISVGAKLFVLTLIVGLIMVSARSWQAAYTQDETSMWTMVGLSLVCAYLSKTLPDMIQGLINGVSSGSGATLGGMAAAGLAGVAAGAAAMSATMGGGTVGGAMKGVGDLIKSSFSGYSGPGGGGGSASPMNSMNSSSSTGSGSSGPSPRTGGGGHPRPTLQPGPAPSSQSSASSSSGNQSSSQTSGQASSQGSSASSVSPDGAISSPVGKMHAAAHMAADAAVRGVSTFGALAVPGMEGSSGVSIGPPPVPPEETPENIIRPESASPPMSDEAINVAESVPAAPAPAVDTMSSLQDALINRGKT